MPRVRSRRAVGQERSMEGRDIKYVYQNRSAQVNSGTPTQRAKIEYRQLDDYEVVDGKTVATDPSGQGRPVLEWTVTFNEAQYDRMGGYYYFTIPKNVSDPYNVVTDYDGAYVDRDGWKDANKESGAGSANAEGVQYVDAGNKLEWRVKNTVGRDYNNVDGLSGVMGDTKKVYVLQLSNSSSARKFTIKYRTIVEDSSQVISYIAGVESKTGLPRNNWYAISGKYDKNLVSQVATPNVTPNLTDTSVNVPVQTVASTSSTLSGTGIPGAKIKLYIDGREQNIGNVTVDSSGNWTTGELPTALNNNQGEGTTIKPRQTVQVTQTVDGTESSRRTVPVSIGETTVEPSSLTTNQDAVVAGQKEVTLKVPHDAGIAYLRYTNTAGQTVEIPVKRDNLSAAWTSQKPEAATVKSVENGKFQDTIVLTMADKIAGTEVAAISNVVEGGFSSVAGWQPRGVENQAPTIESAVEGNQKTVAQGAQLDLASLVTVADKEDDAQATLGDKVHAEVVSVNDDAGTKTVDTNTPGTYKVKYKAVDSQGKESSEIEVTVVVNPARANVAPTVEIPYSDPAPNKKEVYLYTGEEADVDITFNDDSGKIKSASLRKGGNIALKNIDGNPEKQDNEWGYTVTAINSETATPAKIKVTGQVSGIAESRLPKTENDSLELVTRFATATDTDGAEISNNAVKTKNNGEVVGTYLTDPGAVTFVLKAQTKKYDIKTPSEADKVTVSDANNVTDAEFDKIKEKVKLEYSQNNPDARLADKKGTEVENQSDRITSITKDGNKVVVTYKDGSKDTKPLSEFVTKRPTDAEKNTPVAKDQTVKVGEEPKAEDSIENFKDLPVGTTVAFKEPVDTATPGDKSPVVVVTYPDGSTEEVPVKVTVKDPSAPATDADKNTPVAKDQTVKPGDKPNAKDSIGNVGDLPEGTTVEFKTPVDTTTPGDQDATVVVTYPDGSKDEVPVKVTVKEPTDAEKNTPVAKDQTVKPGEKPKAEDSIENFKDLPAGTTVAFKDPVDTTTPGDKAPTVVVTYPDGSTEEVPVKVTVKDPSAPAKPVVDTDLTGKAGTKTPVEVSAEPGSKVELFDKDGKKIGEGVANDEGKATITPTADIPEGGVTAKATDKAGNVSEPSDPKVATDTTAPAKPVVNPVKVGDTAITGTAEAGSTVEVTLPDGSKVSAKADQDGNFSVPVSGLKEGDTVSVTATDDAGNTSNPTSVTVGKGTDTTAPSAPVLNPVKAGATAVTGTAEAGSTVEVTLPDGSKVSAKADQDGNFSVPVSGLKEGDTVSVTATDDAGNTSSPTSVTVGKGIDTKAPDAPVVNTDLTGKAGTRTPIDVIAEPGSKVELFDKDGNKIGEATADEKGLAVVVPTVNIPEGSVTARATDLAGNVSEASAPMFATTSGTVDSFNNGKGSENTPTVVKPSLSGKVESSTTLANHMNLKARANISSTEKDASTLPETGDEVSIGGVVLGGILAAAGLAIAGKRRKEDKNS